MPIIPGACPRQHRFDLDIADIAEVWRSRQLLIPVVDDYD